ncbi:TlpA disulfide reductase family protein [Rugamonas apoptosis]|uniref:TlpA family protein disulfide reductase n=1 Tax=Rugamonas apoptosis TaxID=2758570 RepID=A0A7W2F9Q9_9BURK|nr:TlpA disulfide reductase family protein [Rugamonas apoptosis]MBA5687594.1 TlpA family protein disulfide reductase [Rugamonas apoptosis]
MPSSHRAPKTARRRAILLLLAALAAAHLPAPASAANLALGKPAPPITLHTLDGGQIATGELAGSVVIVTFWATWCGPCHDELPLLSEYAAAHARQGLKVLAFSLDGPDALAEVRAMAAKLSFPVGLLGSAWAGDYGRIWRVPVSFVIGRDGRLADNGWQDSAPAWTRQRLEQIVTPLLSIKE